MLALVALPMVGCFGGDERPAGSAARGGTLDIGWSAPADSLDPARAASARSREALWLVYTPPLTYARSEGRRGTALVPGLAQGLPQVSADGRTYSFRFRPALTYPNGRRLRASDFEHTVRRALALNPDARRFYGAIERVDADDRTRRVTIELRRPDPTFAHVLALLSSGVVPGGTPLRDMSGRPPAGIGPYVIKRPSSGGGFSMRRRRGFRFAGVPEGNVDQIAVRIVPSRAEATQAVIGDRLDYVYDSPPDDLLPIVRSEYADRYEEHSTTSTFWLDLDLSRAPFDDERVRQAVAYAVDGEELERLHEGLFAPACNFLPSSLAGYEQLDPCPYGDRSGEPNLERARALIEDAGADGAAVAVLNAGEGEGAQVSRYWARTLRLIGLDAGPRGRVPLGAATAVIRGWSGEIPHPAPVFRPLLGREAALEAEIRALSRQRDLASAADDWAEVDRRLVEDALAVPYGSRQRSTFVSERMDFENCARFHPVYGNDYSSFCLR